MHMKLQVVMRAKERTVLPRRLLLQSGMVHAVGGAVDFHVVGGHLDGLIHPRIKIHALFAIRDSL